MIAQLSFSMKCLDEMRSKLPGKEDLVIPTKSYTKKHHNKFSKTKMILKQIFDFIFNLRKWQFLLLIVIKTRKQREESTDGQKKGLLLTIKVSLIKIFATHLLVG